RILQKKTALFSCPVPAEVVCYLASELTEDIRMLESGLSGVVAKSSLLGVPIDRGLAESVVKQIVSQRRKITIDLIKQLVCKYYRVSSEELISRSRKQSLVRPRQIAIYLSRRYTDSPLQTIGKTFNRYHATALHSIQSIERGIQQDSAIRQQVDFFRKRIETAYE
ncbi:MAG: chromosomal replication initiator protein DnaA, partial [Desulfobacteraceae bacterium]